MDVRYSDVLAKLSLCALVVMLVAFQQATDA